MCGRFTLTNPDPNVIAKTFNLDAVPADLSAHYNVAPSQAIPTVIRDAEGQNHLAFMHWGLIPSWSKDASGASKMINARAETIATKPAFRTALSKRRCLVIADGFYEWRTEEDGPKTPMYIQLADKQLFGFAGLWERWTEPESGEVLTSCTIITTTPNDLMKSIHNRMPVILPRDAYAEWLDYKQTDANAVTPLLVPYPADKMIAYPVSRRVNNVRYDAPDLVQPEA